MYIYSENLKKFHGVTSPLRKSFVTDLNAPNLIVVERVLISQSKEYRYLAETIETKGKGHTKVMNVLSHGDTLNCQIWFDYIVD